MNLEYSEDVLAFRDELREFLEGWPLTGDEAKLALEEQRRLFRERGIERGYVYRDMPKKFGGAEQPSDAVRDRIVKE